MKTARGILRPLIAAAAVALAAAGARAQSLEASGGEPVEIRSLSATAVIEGRVARVALEEVFFNPGPRDIEATFLLPLPEGSAVERFSMWIDGAETPGELLDSRRARGVYEGIVRARRDPGLLEMADGRLFRARVYPVPARGEKRVRIAWTELLTGDAGSAGWRLPLRLAGRGSLPVGRASVTVDIATERPLAAAWSPTHAVEVVRKDDRHARVSWESAAVRPERDFVLVFQEPSDALGLSFIASRPVGEDGSWLLVLSPAVRPGEKPVPRDVVFCLDTSGSMAGVKIDQAKAALRFGVRTLSAEDRFSLVAFATEPRLFRDALVPATPENVQAALAFIDALGAMGGTAIDEALRASLGMLAGGDAARPAVLLFLTDGLPTIGETDPGKVLARAKAAAPARARVFTFGVGNDVNTVLLDSLAADLRGARDYVAPEEDIEVKVSGLVAKTRFPVITDLVLEVAGVAVSGQYPRRLPDLFRGSELVVAGRYTGAGEATVRVRGRSRDGERVFERKVVFPERAEGAGFVDRLWAVRRVGFLLDEARLHGPSKELQDEVVALARKHGIVTPWTSYLVLEPGADRPGLTADAMEARPEVIETRPIDGRERFLETPPLREARIDGNEAEAQEVQSTLGDPRFDSDTPFEGPGTNSDIGIGGGTGGMFGGRRGGHRGLMLEGGAATESSVEAGLEWLRNHQSPGGYWDGDGFEAMCRTNRCGGPGGPLFDPGLTGLSLLAFLGCGETHKTPRYGAVVRNGLKYLKGIQDAEGCFGGRTSGHFTYNHALATLSMAEAYGLTQSPLFKTSAQNGVNFILQSRNPYLAWRYGVRPQDNDTSVTGWMVMALKSARGAGLDVDPAAFEGAREWMNKVTEPEYGRAGYTARGNGPARPGELMDRFPPDRSESTTAVAVLTRILCGADREDAYVRMGSDLCLKSPPRWDEAAGTIDYYYWYFGTLAMFQVGGERWRAWNESMKSAIVDHQRTDRADDRYGSWDPVDPWARDGGRIYSTAVCTMCLEVYYRYARVCGARSPASLPAAPSGRDAVRVSLEAKALSDASSADAASGGTVPAGAVRRLAGATFEFRGAAWWDSRIPSGAPRTKVAAYSAAWFELARAGPSVEKWLALGRVVVQVEGEVFEVE
jgi:Ca-activated chloride channel family protein